MLLQNLCIKIVIYMYKNISQYGIFARIDNCHLSELFLVTIFVLRFASMPKHKSSK